MVYYLSIGGNSQDSCALLGRLIERLERECDVTGVSDIYTTPANDGVSPDYYNAVVRMNSDLDVDALNARFKAIEREMGRTPADKARGIVPIDIDIVVANDKVIRPHDFEAAYFRIGFEHIMSDCD